MRLLKIQRNVMCGQCKGALLRLQIRYTAILLLPGFFRGWAGTQIGIFVPRKVRGVYRCLGFRFHPWFAPDIAVRQLPTWYVRAMNICSVDFT